MFRESLQKDSKTHLNPVATTHQEASPPPPPTPHTRSTHPLTTTAPRHEDAMQIPPRPRAHVAGLPGHSRRHRSLRGGSAHALPLLRACAPHGLPDRGSVAHPWGRLALHAALHRRSTCGPIVRDLLFDRTIRIRPFTACRFDTVPSLVSHRPSHRTDPLAAPSLSG